jgi:hypothetical protein
LTGWEANIQPGMIWDAGTPVDPNAGHAIILDTYDAAKKVYGLETWGLKPEVVLTQAGLEASQPELIVHFSLEWFNPQGKTPNGDSYEDMAALWVSLGGRQLPPSPFGPPVPPTPPVPPIPPVPPVPVPPAPGGGFTGTLTYVNGVLTAVTPGGVAPVPAGGVEADLKAAGVSPAVIADVLQLLSDVKAKKGIVVIAGDVIKIIADLSTSGEKVGRIDRMPHNEQWAARIEWLLAA